MKTKQLLLGLTFVASFAFGQNQVHNKHKEKAIDNSPTTASTVGALPSSTQTQQNPTFTGKGLGGNNCLSHDVSTEHYADRGLEESYESLGESKPNSSANIPAYNKTPGVNTIAVIFHVVHNPDNPAENVSNAALMAVYNDIVEDYSLTNSDQTQARGAYGFTPSDVNINFCLATVDPTGTPLAEVGVHRVSTTEDWYDSDGGEENKMKYTAQGGTDSWNRDDYLNVWVCDISNGASSGTAGYAYVPNPPFLPSADIDGIVIDYNIGVNNEDILTHEIGHYLGLQHTWGGSGGCGDDDGFGDTPVTAGPSFNYGGSCSGFQEVCAGTQTQYENYMDYSNCTVMFTQEQADYMLDVLVNSRGSLLNSTACDPVDAPPVVDFETDLNEPIIIPVGGSVNFTDLSTNAPDTWDWDFSGGAPVSTLENPTVTFNTAGIYTVTLTASNAFGSGSETKTDYIEVVEAATGTACDTLRNWDPADVEANGFTYYLAGSTNGAWGYIPGHNLMDLYGDGSSMENTLQYCEQFNTATTAEVRRVSMPFFIVEDESGTGTIDVNVYADNAGAPGAVIASETVNISDITVNAWNEFDFTTPASVTGAFWAGFSVNYGSPQDTVLVGVAATAGGATQGWYQEMDTYGWLDATLLGITESIAIDVLLSNGPAPVAELISDTSSACVGADINFNGSNSQNTTNYYWYQTDDPITTIYDSSTDGAVTFNFPTAGDYNVILLTDGSCMTDDTTMTLTVDPAVAATVTPTATTCGNNDGSIDVTAPTGGDGVNYEYSINGTDYSTTSTFTGLAPDDYTIYVRTTGANCETTYTVTVDPSSNDADPTISPNQTVCAGASATITAGNGASYQWFDGINPIGTTASINVTPANTTQYSCVVTSAGGCQATVYSTVTVNDNPTVDAGVDQTVCEGNQVTLAGSGAATYSWDNGISDNTAFTPTVGTTTYTVVGTDANGCTDTDQVDVTANALPGIAVTPTDPSACGATDGEIDVSSTSGGTTGTVEWSGPASGNSGTVTLPNSITGLASGTYDVFFTDDATGCVSPIETAVLTDPGAPVIDPIGDYTACETGYTLNYADITGTNLSGGQAFYSSSGGVGIITDGTTLNAPTSITVYAYDDNGTCSSETSFTVTINSNPAVNAGTDQVVCEGEPVILSGSGAFTYTWDNGVDNGVPFTPAVGIDTYTVTGTDANGCTDTDQVDVTVNSLPSVNAGTDQEVCEGTAVTLSGAGADTYTWDNGVNDGVTFTPTTGTVTYTVTGTDANNCENTDQVNVTVNALPTVTATNSGPYCAGDAMNVSETGGEGTSWSWTSDMGATITSTTDINPTVTGAVDGEIFTVTVTDVNGCVNTTTTTITINPLPTVTFSTVDTTCANYNAFDMSADASPAGGTFNGTGVTGTEFDPGTAGTGDHVITYDYTDPNGCSNSETSTITVDGCSSIKDKVAEQSLAIYPNPVKDVLTIQLDGAFNYEVTDATGKVVLKNTGSDKEVIRTSTFSDGIYFINVSNDVISKTVRVVKN